MSHEGKEQELTQSIVELAQTLNLEIVVEGIERAEQLRVLRSRDCDLGQGFLFGRPVDADALSDVLHVVDDAHVA